MIASEKVQPDRYGDRMRDVKVGCWPCKDCGAVVYDTGTHDLWHALQHQILMRVKDM